MDLGATVDVVVAVDVVADDCVVVDSSTTVGGLVSAGVGNGSLVVGEFEPPQETTTITEQIANFERLCAIIVFRPQWLRADPGQR